MLCEEGLDSGDIELLVSSLKSESMKYLTSASWTDLFLLGEMQEVSKELHDAGESISVGQGRAGQGTLNYCSCDIALQKHQWTTLEIPRYKYNKIIGRQIFIIIMVRTLH